MNILIAPMGTRGDVYPVAYLAQALITKGHKVTFCTSEENKVFIESLKIPFSASGTNFSDMMKKLAPYMGKPLKLIKPAMTLMNEEMHKQFEDIKSVAQGCDLIIGAGTQPMAATVAELYNIPYCHILHLPQVQPTKELAPIIFPFQRAPRWINPLLWWLNEKAYNLMLKPINAIRRKHSLPKVTSFVQYLNSGHMISAVSPELGKQPSDLRDNAVQCDYFFPTTEQELSPRIKEFINAGEPPVYFGFGSVTDKKPTETINALLEMVTTLKVRCILSKGWAAYNELLDREEFFFASEEPHLKLFEKVQLVMHHGGAGTTSTAAHAGAPQLLIPSMADQYYWAKQIEDLGLGLSISKGKLKGKRLIEAVKELISTQQFSKRAKEFQKKIYKQSGISQCITFIERQYTNRLHQ